MGSWGRCRWHILDRHRSDTRHPGGGRSCAPAQRSQYSDQRPGSTSRPSLPFRPVAAQVAQEARPRYRQRRCGRLGRSRREPGRHRGVAPGRQRDRRGGCDGQHARRHRTVRRRPRRWRLHGHLPGQAAPRRHHRRPREVPGHVHPDDVPRPSTGKPLPFEHARRSGLSVGVPGMVATWAKAVRNVRRAQLRAAICSPAIGDGQAAASSSTRTSASRSRRRCADLQSFTSSRKLFLTKAGKPLPVGTRAAQPRSGPDLHASWPSTGRATSTAAPLGADIAHTVQHPPVSGDERRSRSARAS